MRFCHLTPLARRGPWTTPEYGSGSWTLALGADFFPYAADDLAPLEAYDVLLLHTSMAFYPPILHILERFPHKTTVLLLTCDAMFIDPQGFFPGFALPLKALLDRASLAVTETEEAAFFQAMTPTPVVHLPLPVPVEAIRTASPFGVPPSGGPFVVPPLGGLRAAIQEPPERPVDLPGTADADNGGPGPAAARRREKTR
ncbi:MAG: hypothetical protein FJ290_30475 [Planctomycetes bacterium]|nr:hypothetical protein [Planctomycetota bacterium]